MNELDLLRHYRQQNPAKYIQKYGDVLPEEAVLKLKPNMPFGTSVKVEIGQVNEVEMDFKPAPVSTVEPVATVTEATVEPVVEPAVDAPKKRGRKPKNEQPSA